MYRRSDQASSIMPTSGIYGGKTTFASTPLSPRLSCSFSMFLSSSFSYPVLSFTHSRIVFISSSPLALFASYLFPRSSLSLSLSFFSLGLSLSFSLWLVLATVSSAAASLAFHYRRSMECIGLSQHLRR